MDAANDVSAFVSDYWVRNTWIAVFTFWTLLGLVYWTRHLLGDSDKSATGKSEDPEVANKSKWKPTGGAIARRAENAYRVLHDNFSLLLGVVILNTFGGGSTRAVLILTWLYFGFTVIYAFTEIGIEHRFVRFFYSGIFYGLGLAIGGLAFAQGWKHS